AQAADMPLKAPSLVAPVSSWAGWYIGAHFGANWQQSDRSNFGYGAPERTNATGFIGGGQLGYNWQHGNFVFGLEGHGSGLSGRARNDVAYAATTGAIGGLSRVRARCGLAVGDTMVYTTGGVAFGGVKNTAGNPPSVTNGATYSESKTRTGWA